MEDKKIMIWLFYSALMAFLTAMFSNKKEIDPMAHYTKWVTCIIWVPILIVIILFSKYILRNEVRLKEEFISITNSLWPYDDKKDK